MSRLQIRAKAILIAGALSLLSMPALAQVSADRLPDKDVKRLIEQVDEGRDKFEGNLDKQLKNSILRGPNSETDVSKFLSDFQDNTRKLKDRFNDNYAASAEVTTVLKQAAGIDRFMQGTPSVSNGRSEWDAEAASLRRLAEAYGATFPLPEGATVRRMNDKEVEAAAAAIETAADHFEHDLNKTATLAKADKGPAKDDVELLIRYASVLKYRTSAGKPATAEARQLVDQAAKVQTFVDAHQIPTAMANWQAVQASLDKVRQAFGLS